MTGATVSRVAGHTVLLTAARNTQYLELEGEELPYNLLEHSLEQVNTQLSNLRGSQWLDFNPLDEKVISSDSDSDIEEI